MSEQELNEIKRKAENGDAQSQSELGWFYYKGIHGLEVDYEKAVHWFNESVSQKNPHGVAYLGNCYHMGLGVPKLLTIAIIYYKKAMSLGLNDNFINEWFSSAKEEFYNGLYKGQVLVGYAKDFNNYGVLVDLGDVVGLIHITDLSWSRVKDPKEYIGNEKVFQVVVLDFDDEKKHIALGLKQLTPCPWDALDANFKVGAKVTGKVVVMEDYGAFVEVAPGVEGLVHVSEMSWRSQHLRSANDVLKVGDEVEAVILTLDREEHKMSLGIKYLEDDFWDELATKYGTDNNVEGKIAELSDKGAVVLLEDGVVGFCTTRHLKKKDKEAPVTQVGDVVDFKVIEFNKYAKRILLSHLRTWEPRPEVSSKEGNKFVAQIEQLTMSPEKERDQKERIFITIEQVQQECKELKVMYDALASKYSDMVSKYNDLSSMYVNLNLNNQRQEPKDPLGLIIYEYTYNDKGFVVDGSRCSEDMHKSEYLQLLSASQSALVARVARISGDEEYKISAVSISWEDRN